MKKITINSETRQLSQASTTVGYLQENKVEKLEFEIPEEYKTYGRKACFKAQDKTFAKIFDDITGDTLTLTRDMTQYDELEMSIAFFKTENEDEIVARTSILKIYIKNAIICDDDIQPDDPKIVILDNLIDEVTKLDVLVTKNEEKREEYYQEIQEKVDNGDFNGATFTPSVDNEGNISWSNDKNLSNPTTQNIKGPKGEKGDTYNLTEQDKEDISSMTVESSESTFNQYYNDKLKDFNSNAASKTNDFDTNTETKTAQFNSNYTSKVQSFNENSTSKTNDYNTNATTKINEFNTNADTKLQEYNTNADNKIAEYDLHSQELDNKIIDTRNELERVKNDVLETGTDTDTYIHLEDSAWAELQELSVDGVCEQKTTVGRNTLKPTIINTTVLNGVTYIPTYNSNGILEYIRITGTASPINSELSIGNFDVKNETSYVISGTPDISKAKGLFYQLYEKDTKKWKTNIQSNNRIYTATEDASYDLVIHVGKGKTVDAIFYPQVVEGTQIYSYEPYTGGQPSPSPDYPQKIKTITDSLSVTSNNGKDETEENYLESVITANLPEGEFIGKINDTYKDTLKVEYNEEYGQYHLNLYNNIRKVVLNGSESWNLSNLNLTNTKVFSCRLTDMPLNDFTQYFKNTRFQETRGWSVLANTDEEMIQMYTDKTLYIRINNSRANDLNTFKTWLSTHNTEVYYVLAKPYKIDLGIVDMPLSYNEVTNIFTDSDLLPQINAKYYRNFTKTVQNLQVNEKALKQELIDINNRLTALETATASESEAILDDIQEQ